MKEPDKSMHNEVIFSQASDYFMQLVKDIRAANHSIIIESYIFADDEVGRVIMDELVQAHRRGVTVKVLIDGVGAVDSATSVIARLDAAGIDVRIYHPLPWQISLYRWSLVRRAFIANFVRLLLLINHRDHRKLYLIDDGIAYIGSFNLSAAHLSERQHEMIWIDLGVRIVSTELQALKLDFERIWQQSDAKILQRAQRYISNFTVADRHHKRRQFYRIIEQSTARVWIVNAYFAPSYHLIRCLIAAQKRGVDVTIMVSEKSDVPLFPALSRVYFAQLLKHGVKILKFNDAFIHAKYAVIDDVAIVGSSNLNHRSLLHDLELDVVLDNDQSVDTISQHFIEHRQQCQAITESELAQRSWWDKCQGYCIYLIRYWL